MNTIPTTLTVVNETKIRGEALRDLIKTHLGIQGYYGFRSIGAADPPITFPCFMVEPKAQRPSMDRLGKYRKYWDYIIYVYVTENNPDAIISLCSFVGEALVKLLSNNALGDLGSGNSNKFKTYANPNGGYYWLDSEMTSLEWSANYLNAVPNIKYMRAGVMRFTIQDVVIA
jgi:hypothetical protein